MSAPTKLFLEFGPDSKFHINDQDGFAFGDGYEIPEAIQHARMVSDAPIDIEDDHAGNHRHVVTEKPEGAIADAHTFIAALAEIAGMKVTIYYDDNIHFLGYGMELIEWTPHPLFF